MRLSVLHQLKNMSTYFLTLLYVMELEHALSLQTELKFALYYKDLKKIGHSIY